MQEDLLLLMKRLAPDLADEMARRALILERIAALQPVGRRQLATRLNMQEREIRAIAQSLREQGFIELNASGMVLTPDAALVLDGARSFSRAMRGLTDLETAVSKAYGVNHVYIASGDCDSDPRVLQQVGRMAAMHFRTVVQSGSTLAVTGGSSVAAVAHALQPGTPMNVMVVPARGGMGRSMETQANTLAAQIAQRLGGHHRLLHVPDQMDVAAMQEMLKVPQVSEVVELLQRADVILHGIGRADNMAHNRHLPLSLIRRLNERGAVAEAFGCYFSMQGQILYAASSLGVDMARLQPSCQMVAVAAGQSKGEAIAAVLRRYPHAMLVTDEAAAQKLLALAEK